MRQIPIAGPWITRKEIDFVTDAVTNAWYENSNIYNERFEEAFSEFLGVPHSVTLPSCTSAIHLSLLASGIGAGDEVIVPDVTWIATAAPISYVGATPVFADIDEKSWCLSAQSFEQCITSKTKAVIPVDLYGNIPEMDSLLDVAKRHNIVVIEDAAEAIGAMYKKRRAGTFGKIGVFSFHGSKTLTTGEGGMLVTDNGELFERILCLRDHGRKPGDTMFKNAEIAHKYKMSSLQAALGLAQLQRIEELIMRKRRIFSQYETALSDIDGITLNFEGPNVFNSFWMVTAVVDSKFGLDKTFLIERLKQAGINCRPFFNPLSSLPAYAGLEQASIARKRNRVSYEISPFALNLPSALVLTQSDIEFVANIFGKTLGLS
jgi:perosamine synthetase